MTGTQQEDTEKDSVESLWLQYKENRDIGTRNQLVLRYDKMVKSIVSLVVRSCHMEASVDDLISEGVIALIDAIERFDPGRNVKFSTFASIKVRGAMLDYCRKQVPGYRRKTTQKARSLREAEENLTNRLMREPTTQEMADFLCLSVADYEKERALTNTVNLYSLETILSEWNSEYLLINFSDSGSDDPENRVAQQDMERELAQRIRELSEEQQLVLSLFYSKELEIHEIAEVLGMEAVRVSQIRYQAVRRLKKIMKPYMDVE